MKHHTRYRLYHHRGTDRPSVEVREVIVGVHTVDTDELYEIDKASIELDSGGEVAIDTFRPDGG